MEQPVLFDATLHVTVTELTRLLRKVFEREERLKDIWVQGEISNTARPASGHIYFTLKDAGASLKCVIWKSDAFRMSLIPRDGLAVEAHGGIDIYEAGGQYQLYVDVLRPFGEGALYQEFLRLKALLEAEGLFDVGRKRPIPEAPLRIGIVTSKTGAALRDILNTLQRRMPLAQVVIAPASVQGVDSPEELGKAIQAINENWQPEVIILARGGGSIEDLWSFNDERVVRALVGSKAPIITGIGHETDFTLADFAADLRAPTPTAAAELATSITRQELEQQLLNTSHLLSNELKDQIDQRHAVLATALSMLKYNSPLRRLQHERQRLDETYRRVITYQAHRLQLSRTRLVGTKERFEALSPLAVLKRGYAVVMKNELVVSSKKQVSQGDGIKIRLQDGQVGARVTGEG